MERVSKKGKQNVFSVPLTTVILNFFLCVLDERSRERTKTWAGLFMFEMFSGQWQPEYVWGVARI